MSEWASTCSSCGTDLAGAADVVDDDWDAPILHPRSLPPAPGGLSRRSVGTAAGIAVVLIATVVVLAIGKADRHHQSTHQVLCAAPTVTWSPGSPTQVGAPGAVQVGPLTFHPAYFPDDGGAPTRVILHPIRAMTSPLTLTGWSCETGRAFRFWYPPYGSNGELPALISQAPAEGALTVTVPELPSGEDFLGYMLFPKAGRWDVEVRDGNGLVGNILFVLPKA